MYILFILSFNMAYTLHCSSMLALTNPQDQIMIPGGLM